MRDVTRTDAAFLASLRRLPSALFSLYKALILFEFICFACLWKALSSHFPTHELLTKSGIGTRLRLGEHTGTLRFSGAVDGTTGTWLGVEWDDPSRGKHDGVKDGRRYFACR